MASINSITGSLSSTSSLRGYGGLSSGLDRDTLIESLTYATRTKIENQKAKQTKIEWQQTAIRNIINKAYDFTNTYASYSSSTNIASSAFFARNNITTAGENSKYLSVSGTATSGNLLSVVGVKQLAENAQFAGTAVSTAQLTTGGVDLDADFDADLLNGKFISVKIGSTTYHANLSSIKDVEGYDSSDPNASLEAMLNKAFESTEAGTSKLSDFISASVDANGVVTFTGKGSNAVNITGGTALENLGFSSEDEIELTGEKSVEADSAAKAVERMATKDYLAGKSITFSYNGVSKSITLSKDITDMASLQADLQSKLDSAFGKGRIAVETATGADGKTALSFKTIIPDSDNDPSNNEIDATSVLSITGGASDLFGDNGILGVAKGTSNRVNLSENIAQSGLAGASGLSTNADGKYELKINGKTLEFDQDATVQSIMDAINNDKTLNMTISYQQNSDRFIITSNEEGASGSITLEGDLAKALFGEEMFKDENGVVGNSATVQGQDAIIAVQYAGDSGVTEIRRGTNTLSMDGLNINVKGTFGYDADGNRIQDTEAVTFEAKVDTDKIVQGIKDMVAAYNEIVDLINSEMTTKPDSDYSTPLTATQKEDMSETEIKEYKETAKQGLLFGDSDLRMFANDLRYVLTSSDIAAFAEIGITESTEYSDNGKLIIDETKLREALESDPEKVSDLFTRKSGIDKDGNQVAAGLMQNITDVMNRYAGTVGATKGLLVTRAGSEHSPLSLLSNTMKTEIDNITDYIDRLLDQLESEEDRYISQFTTLETLISQMNSQSSYLSSLYSY